MSFEGNKKPGCQAAGLRAEILNQRIFFARLLVLRTRLLPIWGQLRLFAQDVKHRWISGVLRVLMDFCDYLVMPVKYDHQFF